jgi:hypothetical protein
MRVARAIAFVVCAIFAAVAIGVPAARAQRRLPSDRETRTTINQQKINAKVMYEIYRRRGDAKARSVPPQQTNVAVDRHGRVFVDVHADVTAPLKKKMAALGGKVVSTSVTSDSVIVWMPLLTLERLAADPHVRTIEPAAGN